MKDFIQLQITYAERGEAAQAAQDLVTEHWAACAQIVGPIESVYNWRGKLCSGAEWLLLAKTSAELFPEIVKFISKRHSYECPQIVALPISSISDSYRTWLMEQLSRPGDCLEK